MAQPGGPVDEGMPARSRRRGPSSPVQVLALRPGRAVRLPDRLATEEPLQIRVQPGRTTP